MKGISRSRKESTDVVLAEENLKELKEKLDEMEILFEEDLNVSSGRYDVFGESLGTRALRPTKSNISIRLFNFVWVPE